VTTTPLPRRAIVGAVLATALVGGGVIPLLAAHADDCHALVDPKGDSKLAPQGQTVDQDPNMDILSIDHAIVGDRFVSTIKVADLTASPANSPGDEFDAGYTVNGKDINAYVTRYDPSQIGTAADAGGNGFYQNALQVGGTEQAGIEVTAKYDEKAETVAISYKLADVEKAVGAPLAGATLTKLTGSAKAAWVAASFTYDTAAGTTPYVLGTCDAAGGADGSGAAPAPSGSPSDSPAPAPSTPAAPVGGSGDPSKLPAADCVLVKDPKGDAHTPNANVPNDPDLDMTGLTLGSDAKNLYAYIKVDKLAAGPQIHDGHRFYVSFTFNKHNFTMAGSAYKDGSGQIRDGLAQTGQAAHVTQLAVDGISNAADPARFTGAGPGFVESGLKYVFDQKTSTVTAILPIADLEKYGKAPSAGTTVTSVYGGTFGDAYAVAQQADAIPDGATSPDTSKLTWTVGDNHCFAAGTSPLSSVGAVKAQYGDVAAVAAKLVDAAGAPVAGKTVTFTLGSTKATGTTGADGIAKGALVVNEKAGKRSLVITSDDATVSVDFTVVLEKTALKAVGGKAGVTATLTDDDNKPVAGQAITFASGSKKVTAKTDAKGVAKATGLPPGNIKVTYAGAAGMYTASSTTTKA
jgi:hypothetical protein